MFLVSFLSASEIWIFPGSEMTQAACFLGSHELSAHFQAAPSTSAYLTVCAPPRHSDCKLLEGSPVSLPWSWPWMQCWGHPKVLVKWWLEVSGRWLARRLVLKTLRCVHGSLPEGQRLLGARQGNDRVNTHTPESAEVQAFLPKY